MKDSTAAEPGEHKIMIVTSSHIPGFTIQETKGLVWASTVRAKNLLEDLRAMGGAVAGGEISEYVNLVNEARHEIFRRLNVNAKRMNANAIVDVRLNTASIMPGTVEILAYGTAVVIAPEK